MSAYQLALIILGVAGTGAGLLLLAMGLHGRRVDEHPICRRCRYDLRRLGELSACPECGADLSGRRAVRIGHRRRRPALIVLGSLILLMGLGGGTIVGVDLATEISWQQYKPLWWLERERRSANANVSAAAEQEILRRLWNDDLSPTQIDAINSDILARQPDLNSIWNGFDPQFIERCIELGLVDEETIGLYLKQGLNINVSVTTRQRAHAGGPLPIYVHTGPNRIDFSKINAGPIDPERVRYMEVLRFPELRKHGEVIHPIPPGYMGSSVSAGRTSAGTTVRIDLPEGAHTLVAIVTHQIYRGTEEQLNRIEELEPLMDWTSEHEIMVEIVGEDEPVVTLIDDSSLESTIRSRALVDLAHDEVSIGGNMSYRHAGHFGFLMIDNPPIDLTFDVVGRADGVETLIDTRTFRAGTSHQGQFFTKSVRDLFPEARAIDIILRANPAVAERHPEIVEIWGGEIVFRDVPLYADTDGSDL